jgi:hypothetical protein
VRLQTKNTLGAALGLADATTSPTIKKASTNVNVNSAATPTTAASDATVTAQGASAITASILKAFGG